MKKAKEKYFLKNQTIIQLLKIQKIKQLLLQMIKMSMIQQQVFKMKLVGQLYGIFLNKQNKYKQKEIIKRCNRQYYILIIRR
ncbi:hypothetical protein IMG5_055810 [Ichthyophthirius multifiliis]|uniref:Uncharacterized protein n=1 Tax=Ichthyophthirius multifiliis TaxID=5932 RepID=G0QN64_ICHMU|nr:hypothetical protein IMG5_055810 [Ichthyophthirius multifiliis]EGR33336.1 hypothetical protein IMG5_055810 [Ichthyophthirius multifiliis]|eukprot:XP_004037322.1 hypothetical protein IMG5_055810 [Ichthyophthirius multifiliis]